MPVAYATSRLYWEGAPLGALYENGAKVWEPVPPVAPWSPLDIAGLTVWLDAADYVPGTWPNRGTGAPVTTTGTPPMTYGTNLNGKPTVRFKTSEARVHGAWSSPVHDWTVVYLVRWMGPGVGRGFSAQYPPSNMLLGFHTTGKDQAYDNGTWIVGPDGPNWWPTQPGPWRMYGGDSQQGAPLRFFIDGTLVGSSAGADLGGLTNGWVLSGYDVAGTSETMDMEVPELLVYDRRLSDAERQQVEGYLRAKYFPAWTPAALPGLGLWLEADKITGVAHGGGVTLWPDASGKGHHATPVAAVPTWRQADMNGKPTVLFNASRMTIAGWGTALTGKSEYTLFQVLSQKAFGNYPVITTAPNYTSWQWLTEFETGTNAVYWGHGNGSYRAYHAAMVSGEPTMLTYALATPGAGGSRFYKNGVQITGFTPNGNELGLPVPNVGADVTFGAYFDGSYPLDDHVAAMIWYDRFLIDSERVQVENYLRAKYGTP